MKLRIISLVIFVLSMCLILSSCNEGNELSVEFDTNAENIYVNTKSPNTMSLNLALFSKKKIKNVSYIGFESTNVNMEDFDVSIIDNELSELNEHKYKGMYTKYMLIEITKKNNVKECEINSIILNVDGTNQKITFKNPLKHQFDEGNIFTEELQPQVIPNEFASSFINQTTTGATYEFYANEDVTLEKIYFDDYINPVNVTYAINDKGSNELSLPVKINKDEKISLNLSFTSENIKSTDYVATNMVFEYKINNGNTTKSNSAYVVFDPVLPLEEGNLDNVDCLIDSSVHEES